MEKSNRFMPDEIIVKFRAPVPDANGVEGTPDDKSNSSKSLRTAGPRFRVREMRPIVKDFDRGQAQLRFLRDVDQSRLTQKQRQLLRRQKRAAATGRRPELGNIYRVRVDLDAGASLDKVLAAYRSRADVEYAELNPIISACVTPNDPSYADQWALGKIHASEAWDTCRGSGDVIVAVLDTGVDYDHPDLQDNLWTNEAERVGLPWVDDDDDTSTISVTITSSRTATIPATTTTARPYGIIAAVGNNARILPASAGPFASCR
jgi:subtilisin family serine protease